MSQEHTRGVEKDHACVKGSVSGRDRQAVSALLKVVLLHDDCLAPGDRRVRCAHPDSLRFLLLLGLHLSIVIAVCQTVLLRLLARHGTQT